MTQFFFMNREHNLKCPCDEAMGHFDISRHASHTGSSRHKIESLNGQ